MTYRIGLRRWRLFNRRSGFGLLRTLLLAGLVAGIAVAVNVTGIHVVGSIDGWQQWLEHHSAHFLTWRLSLYTATVCGWWWMCKRLLQREPSCQTHQRLLRVEIASVIALVLLESSQLRHSTLM